MEKLEQPYGFIYKITNTVNGKVYIGQTTTSIKHRLASHKNDSKHKKTKISRAIAKYGIDSFTIEQIDFAYDLLALDAKEIKYIQELKALSDDYGYNLAKGGNSNWMTEETKKKISEKTKGRPAWNKGKSPSPEQLKKMSDNQKGKPSPFKGRVWPEKDRLRISENLKKKYSNGTLVPPQLGRPVSEETKKKIQATLPKKPVRGISIIDGSIIEFISMKEAERAGFFGSGISAFLKGIIKSAYKGYRWELISA